MKNLTFIALMLSSLYLGAQNYDLIVTTNGDSIACHIDSITDVDIHFEMKINDRWLHTNTPLSDCINYEYGSIDKNNVIFKYGTSYIKKIPSYKVKTEQYDLLITNNGDSIACFIDSITNTHIYLEMKFNNRWVKTNLETNNIKEYKFNAFEGEVLIFKEGTSYIKEVRKATKYFDRSLYSNRYLFAPSAIPMKENLFSYSNITLGLHDLQYSFSDEFSLGFGTTIFFFPIYFMPIYSIPVNENSSFAVGDLFLFSFFEDLTFVGNLFYGMYTRGNAENNYSIGLGLWTTTESDLAAQTISPAINFSAMLKTGYNSYFITENYAFQYNTGEYASYSAENEPHFDEDFTLPNYILSGITGFRFIGRVYPRNSWQFAMAYIIMITGDHPDKYNHVDWEINGETNTTSFIPWPIISYTRKF